MSPGPVASLAVFIPQSRLASTPDIERVRRQLQDDDRFRELLVNVQQLEDTYELLCTEKREFASLTHGRACARMLAEWVTGRVNSRQVANARSAMHSLPLLLLIQCTQLLSYLDASGLTFVQLLDQLRDCGGIQGYCGGLPAAISLACAVDLKHALQNACKALHLTFAIGLAAELGDDSRIEGITTVVIRLKHEGQGDELVGKFPKTHVAAVNDARSVTITGPSDVLKRLCEYATQQGMLVSSVDIRGKTHNPENNELVSELARICHRHDFLTLPDARDLTLPLRTASDASLISEGSLTSELISTVLATRCEWYTVIQCLADDLASSSREAHNILSFGIGDCLSMSPFYKRQLKCTKLNIQAFLADRFPVEIPDQPLPPDAVAIVGLSCRFPGANDFEEMWNLVSEGVDTHQEVPHDRLKLPTDTKVNPSAAFVRGRTFYGNFLADVELADQNFFGYNTKEMLHMDPQQRLLLELAYEAIESGGFQDRKGNTLGSDVGCFIGASFVDYVENTSSQKTTAYNSTGTLRAFLCGRLSHKFGWSGPCELVDTACSSSLVALNRACKALQYGECKVAVTGGVNIISSVNNYLDLARTGFLSPTGQCKPFDQAADGYCRAEGAGLVILKPYATAVADGDIIYGVVRGTATNHGSSRNSIVAPDVQSQADLCRQVLLNAKMESHEISYVEAHGTGTQAGDRVEMTSIRKVLAGARRLDVLSIGSIKANIGHAETAAGVAGLLKVIAMLFHQKIPPLAKHHDLNREVPPLQPDRMAIDTKLRPWKASVRAALVNSYGAAGSNATCICSETPAASQKHHASQSYDTYPLILSATSWTSLQIYVQKLSSYLLRVDPTPRLSDVVYFLSERRQRHRFCMIGVASTIDKLVDSLEPHEYFISPKPVVFCFSGQGSTMPPLDDDFLRNHTMFHDFLVQCDDILLGLGIEPISRGDFSPQHDQTVVSSQIRHVVTQLAFAHCHVASGLRPSAVVGHSLGELAALAFCEILSLDDCLLLVATRATLMQANPSDDKGAMLAIEAESDVVQQLLSVLRSELPLLAIDIACYNSPTSYVLAGNTAAIDLAEQRLGSQKRSKAQRLNTTHAFHSALLDPFLAEIDRVASTLRWKPPKYPLEMCTAESTDATTSFSASRHAREPVFFEQAVRRLESRFGQSLWVEVGISGPVISMTRRALRQPTDHEFLNFPMDADISSAQMMSQAATKLWKLGYDITPWHFLPISSRGPVWLPPYQFDRAKLWLEKVNLAQNLLDEFQDERRSLLTTEKPEALPRRLVTLAKELSMSETEYDFDIHTELDRFQRLTSGHCIRGEPMCPASLYLECVSLAFEYLLVNVHHQAFARLRFRNVAFQTPLQNNTSRKVQIRMVLISSANFLYSFTISSYASMSAVYKATSHCTGTIDLPSSYDRQGETRLLSRVIKDFSSQECQERLTQGRAYKLFSQVVEYDDFFQGISDIKVSGLDAYAEISIPRSDLASVDGTCVNSIAADCFVQVAGLLVNSKDDVNRGEVMVASGFDCVDVLQLPKLNTYSEWKVFVQVSKATEKQSQCTGDVYVLAPDSSLAAIFGGCRFSSTSIRHLQKTLGLEMSREKQQRTNKKASRTTTHRGQQSELNAKGKQPTVALAVKNLEAPTGSNGGVTLDQILTTHLGFSATSVQEIDRYATLASIGLDSLASVEIAGELAVHGFKFDGPSLMELSIAELEDFINGSRSSFSAGLSRHTIGGVHSARLSPTSNPTDTPPVTSSTSTLPRIMSETNPAVDTLKNKLRDKLGKFLGIDPLSIVDDAEFQNIGVDSLCLIELREELSRVLPVELSEDDITLSSSISSLLVETGIFVGSTEHSISSTGPLASQSGSLTPVTRSTGDCLKIDPTHHLEEAIEVGSKFWDSAAQACGFSNYWKDAGPTLDKLAVKYITEAFRKLGIDLSLMSKGQGIGQMRLLPKHSMVLQRYYSILKQHAILDSAGDTWVRGSASVPQSTIDELRATALHNYPQHAIDIKLMGFTGARLADCLIGEADPVALLFGNNEARAVLNDFYRLSPMLKTLTEVLLSFIRHLVASLGATRRLRILEVGAGTGGSTASLAPLLHDIARPERYTFTDISGTLVRQAKSKFGHFPWMDFQVFDLENDVPSSMRGNYDIAVATNCVHATKSRSESLRRISEALSDEGIVILSEQTHVIDWYDIVFGLLDGWWYSNGGQGYPICTASQWETDFHLAGFNFLRHTSGATLESTSQQLLVASKSQSSKEIGLDEESSTQPLKTAGYSSRTFEYKNVDGVPLQADVFVPDRRSAAPIPICVLIHGGGYMALSRKSIRLSQVMHMVTHGILPISIDYRLCPSESIIKGPMADVRDAYIWATEQLPSILLKSNVCIDSSRVGVVGWSSGGHLAMTLAWTLAEKGRAPPKAILPFYAPVDLESINDEISPSQSILAWKPSLSIEQALQAIPDGPMTAYHGKGSLEPMPGAASEIADLGCSYKDDARSDLIAWLFHDARRARPVLLYGKQGFHEFHDNDTQHRIVLAQISPLAKLGAGLYATPTLLVHGENDQVAPFSGARRFADQLLGRGIDGGLLRVHNLNHLFDLRLSKNDAVWREVVEPAYDFIFRHIGART